MPSVFISYARVDRAVALELRDLLAARQIDVWFDGDLQGGEAFRAEIADKIDRVDKVVVLWTSTSVASKWVLDEATLAADLGKLVPVSARGVRPPLGFGQLHTYALEADRDGIVAALQGVAGAPARTDRQAMHAQAAESVPPADTAARHGAPGIVVSLGLLLLFSAIYAAGFLRVIDKVEAFIYLAPPFVVFALAFGAACATVRPPRSGLATFLTGLFVPATSIAVLLLLAALAVPARASVRGGSGLDPAMLKDLASIVLTLVLNLVNGFALALLGLAGRYGGLEIRASLVERSRARINAEQIRSAAAHALAQKAIDMRLFATAVGTAIAAAAVAAAVNRWLL